MGNRCIDFFTWKGSDQGRASFGYGTILSALVLAFMFVQFMDASRLPPIPDISTDRQDPPEFDHLIAVRGTTSNDLTTRKTRVATGLSLSWDQHVAH
ncbi:MAG: hypothetical protein CM1200mP9_04380 [Gammaproteobacteria bacterium]|nr:MAG: hypothetical protein CM1200mP9_04380 [Gammaproteobacteria bacterium]